MLSIQTVSKAEKHRNVKNLKPSNLDAFSKLDNNEFRKREEILLYFRKEKNNLVDQTFIILLKQFSDIN